MLDLLIKLANELDSLGRTEEADQVDHMIRSLAQDSNLSISDLTFEHDLEGIRAELLQDVEREILRLKTLAKTKPESFLGSKSNWIWFNLEKSPIKITYP